MASPATSPPFATIACVLAALQAGVVAFGADARGEDRASGRVEGLPIESGFVILQGRYLAPPYVVGQRGNDLFLNGEPLGGQWLSNQRMGPPGMGPAGRPRRGPMRPGPGFRPGWRFPGGRRPGPLPAQNWQPGRVAWLERQLREGALVIGLDGDTTGVVPRYMAIPLLTALVADAPNETKEQSLADLDVRWLTSAQWRGLVESFQPSADLTQRVRVLAEQHKQGQTAEAVSGGAGQDGPFGAAAARYAIIVGAMVLAVVALGTLLNHRPKASGRWGDVDAAGDSIRLLVRNVALLAVLGLFDLGCTVIANQAGGMLELNPLGSQLAAHPVALAAFKVTTLVLACGILLALRRYRGAQVVSWWLCLVCTVLAFRWATYTSLFLA